MINTAKPNKSNVTPMTGGMLGFPLKEALSYIDLWVAHFPGNLQDLNIPIPVPKLVGNLGYKKENATL